MWLEVRDVSRNYRMQKTRRYRFFFGNYLRYLVDLIYHAFVAPSYVLYTPA